MSKFDQPHNTVPESEKVNYDQDFVRRVKNELPNEKFLLDSLIEGHLRVGGLLRGLTGNMTSEDIVDLFKQGKSEEVLESAKKTVKIQKLFDEWDEKYGKIKRTV